MPPVSESTASLADILVILFFLGFPLLGRILRALAERRQQAAGTPDPQAQERRRIELEELAGRGRELWEQMLGGGVTTAEEDAREAPFERERWQPAPRPEPSLSRAEPVLAGGLAGEDVFVSSDLTSPLSGLEAPVSAGAPDWADVGVGVELGELFSDATSGIAGGLSSTSGGAPALVHEPLRVTALGAGLLSGAMTPRDWRRAVVLNEVLAPPLALRRGNAPPAPPGLA